MLQNVYTLGDVIIGQCSSFIDSDSEFEVNLVFPDGPMSNFLSQSIMCGDHLAESEICHVSIQPAIFIFIYCAQQLPVESLCSEVAHTIADFLLTALHYHQHCTSPHPPLLSLIVPVMDHSNVMGVQWLEQVLSPCHGDEQASTTHDDKQGCHPSVMEQSLSNLLSTILSQNLILSSHMTLQLCSTAPQHISVIPTHGLCM